MQPRPGGAANIATPLSGFRMRLIARGVASRLDEWQDFVRMDAASRWHARLHGSADHDVWLESWLPGQKPAGTTTAARSASCWWRGASWRNESRCWAG